MGDAAWVIPVAVLASICGVGLIFVWWWFPRTWARGTAEELRIRDAEKAEREAYMRARQDRIDRGELADPEPGKAGDTGTITMPPRTFKYTPPAYTSY